MNRLRNSVMVPFRKSGFDIARHDGSRKREICFSGRNQLLSVRESQSPSGGGEVYPALAGFSPTGHIESGIAHGAAKAAQVRDEPTRREPATFDYRFGDERLVGAQ